MNILFLRGFNNYFNRTVRKYLTLEEYREHAINTVDYPQINFNPNDGVMTELIVGGPNQLTSEGVPLDWDKTGSPDYAVCYEQGKIISRWYILESERTREGQFKLALRRDVIVDNIDEIVKAPVFIEKGKIDDINNPLLFNNENMTYNQIKEKEYLLKDSTGVPWIIGYVAKNAPETDKQINALISNMLSNTLDPSDLPWKFDLQNDVLINGGVDLNIKLSVGHTYQQNAPRGLSYTYQGFETSIIYKDAVGSMTVDYNQTYPKNGSYIVNQSGASGSPVSYTYNKNGSNPPSKATVDEINSKMVNFSGNAKTLLQQKLQADFATATTGIDKYRGKIVYDETTKKYYRISFDTVAGGSEWVSYFPGEDVREAVVDYAAPSGYTKTPSYFAFYTRGAQLKPVYTEVTSQSITLMLQHGGENATRAIVNNSVYDMFALPYGELNIIDTDGVAFKTTAESSMAIARAIATTLSDAAVYDLQLLPYCPIREVRDYYETTGNINLSDFENKYWATAQSGEAEGAKKTTVLFWASNSSGTFNIPLKIEVPKDATELKIYNETIVTRLCSPNYAGMFEFSLAKNGGLDYINIDYNYRPYSPYIHANPNFKNLYGKDWNDARGLVCGGDFTISSVSSAWQNYQVQNKNYQVIFDRQIQNMDVNNKIALEQQQWNGIAGSITAGLTGMAGGSIVGGFLGGAGIGAAVGGIASATLSGIGAAKDKEWLLRQQGEAKQYVQDMYNFNLGNIQALPYSLSKTDSLTENNKLWPFIEIYNCTDKEREALRNKLKYNGMTIMTIGNIFDNLDLNSSEKVYFQGQLIRMDDIKDDSHVLNEIYSELKKGLFFIGSEIHINLGGNYVSTTSNK